MPTIEELVKARYHRRPPGMRPLPTEAYAMSFREIGKALGISDRAAETAAARGLAKLERALAAKGITHESDLAVHTGEWNEEHGFGGPLPAAPEVD